MATQLLKTVKPSGGDYTALETCLNANEQNLVTADKYLDVEIDGDWSSADTAAVTIHNYTTDATRYINIYTTATARHTGVWSESKYRLYVSDSYGGLSIQDDYVRLTGLQIRKGDVGIGGHCCIVGGGTDTRVSTTICRQFGGTTNYEVGIFCSNAGATWTIWNTIVAGLGDNSNGYCAAVIVYDGTVNLYGCTLIGGASAIKVDSGKTCTAKNVYGRGSVATAVFNNSGTLNQTNCATSDATAGGTDPHDDVPYTTTTFQSVTAWDANYLKLTSDGGLTGHGATLTDDPPGSTALGVDIAGTTRS